MERDCPWITARACSAGMKGRAQRPDGTGEDRLPPRRQVPLPAHKPSTERPEGGSRITLASCL